MGLSIMILISMISSQLPNASKPEYEPLVNILYKTALGAFVVQMIVILLTDALRELNLKPPNVVAIDEIYQFTSSSPLKAE